MNLLVSGGISLVPNPQAPCADIVCSPARQYVCGTTFRLKVVLDGYMYPQGNIGVGIVAVLLPKLCVPLFFVHAETGCCNEVVGVGMCWSATWRLRVE